MDEVVPLRREPAAEDSRSGPLAELLLRETVSALRADLRKRSTELAQLRGALSELNVQLAAATAARDAALTEAIGLRVELDRLGRELAGAREQLGGRNDELAQARALLADARALATRLREPRPQPASPS
jgi:chromosome segregation ATPase